MIDKDKSSRAIRIIKAYDQVNSYYYDKLTETFHEFVASKYEPQRIKEISDKMYRLGLAFYSDSIIHLKHLRRLSSDSVADSAYSIISKKTKMLATGLNEFCWKHIFGQEASEQLINSRDDTRDKEN